MTLVAIITVRSEAVETFRAYEREAARIMGRFGGTIERVVVVPPEYSGGPLKEVHIVTFPDERAFLAYRADGTLGELAWMREKSVIATEILVGEDGSDYGAAR